MSHKYSMINKMLRFSINGFTSVIAPSYIIQDFAKCIKRVTKDNILKRFMGIRSYNPLNGFP